VYTYPRCGYDFCRIRELELIKLASSPSLWDGLGSQKSEQAA
jgi:hypothetical protein